MTFSSISCSGLFSTYILQSNPFFSKYFPFRAASLGGEKYLMKSRAVLSLDSKDACSLLYICLYRPLQPSQPRKLNPLSFLEAGLNGFNPFQIPFLLYLRPSVRLENDRIDRKMDFKKNLSPPGQPGRPDRQTPTQG